MAWYFTILKSFIKEKMATLKFNPKCAVENCDEPGVQEVTVVLNVTESPVGKIIMLRGMLCMKHKQPEA